MFVTYIHIYTLYSHLPQQFKYISIASLVSVSWSIKMGMPVFSQAKNMSPTQQQPGKDLCRRKFVGPLPAFCGNDRMVFARDFRKS